MKIIVPADPKGITSLEHRGYTTSAARKIAVRKLIRQGYNYFLGYRDTQAEFALQISKVPEMKGVRVVDCYPMFYGTRISCTKCGKRHPVRVGGNSACPGLAF